MHLRHVRHVQTITTLDSCTTPDTPSQPDATSFLYAHDTPFCETFPLAHHMATEITHSHTLNSSYRPRQARYPLSKYVIRLQLSPNTISPFKHCITHPILHPSPPFFPHVLKELLCRDGDAWKRTPILRGSMRPGCWTPSSWPHSKKRTRARRTIPSPTLPTSTSSSAQTATEEMDRRH